MSDYESFRLNAPSILSSKTLTFPFAASNNNNGIIQDYQQMGCLSNHKLILPDVNFDVFGLLDSHKFKCGMKCRCLYTFMSRDPEHYLDLIEQRDFHKIQVGDTAGAGANIGNFDDADANGDGGTGAKEGGGGGVGFVQVRQAKSKSNKIQKYTVHAQPNAQPTTATGSFSSSSSSVPPVPPGRSQDIERASLASRRIAFDIFSMNVAREMSECCMKAIGIVTGRSNQFFYAKNAQNKARRIDTLRGQMGCAVLDETAAEKIRKDKGLPKLSDLKNMQFCCTNACLSKMSDRHLLLIWLRWCNDAPGSQKRRRELIAELLFDPLSCRPRKICHAAFHRLFGASSNLVARIKNKLEIDETNQLMDDWVHKMAIYRQEHGPANKKLTDKIQSIFDRLIEIYYRTDPEGGYAFAVDTRMSSAKDFQKKVNEILHGGDESEFDNIRHLSLSSARRAMKKYATLHSLKLCGMGYDHQLCPHCKMYKMMLRLLHLYRSKLMSQKQFIEEENEKEKNEKELEIRIAAVDTEMKYLETQEKKHLERDLDQRMLIHAFTDTSKMLHNRHVAERLSINESLETTYPLKSIATMDGSHVDDCSAQTPPYTGLEALKEMQLYNNSMNGGYNLVTDSAILLMTEAGLKKNASSVLEECLMNIFCHINGQQASFTCYDCGPLNHGSLIAGALLMLLVDLGILEFSVAIFFWQMVRYI